MSDFIKFGTDGWRALMNGDFTQDRLEIVVQAIANYLIKQGKAKKGVIVGYDTRNNSAAFAEASAAVMIGNGIPAQLPSRPLPTPLTAFAITELGLAGGLMITASHNPPLYNGIKFISEFGGPAGTDVTGEIEKELAGMPAPKKASLNAVERQDIDQILIAYRNHISGIVDFQKIKDRKMKVGVDALFGAGYGLLDKLLKEEAGCEVIAIHNYPDPEFGGEMPDPSSERLEELRQTVQKEQAMLGLALDGDADRFGVIDPSGNFYNANKMLAMLADYMIESGKEGKLARTVATTHFLDDIARAHGRELVETPVGFKYLAAEMIKDHVLVGGEESGGLSVGGHIPEKDGLIANILFTEMVAARGKTLDEQWKDLVAKYGERHNTRIDLHFPAEKRTEFITKVNDMNPSMVNNQKVVKVNKIDGTKLVMANGDWMLIRPSGTEPIFRVYLETHDNRHLENLRAYAMDYLGL